MEYIAFAVVGCIANCTAVHFDRDACFSLFQTMKPETARTLSAAVCVTMAVAFVVVAATGGTFAALVVIAGILSFAAFIGLTQPC